METLTELQPILISEERAGIDSLDQLASTNTLTLQQINNLAPELKTEELILEACRDPKRYVLNKFFIANPPAKEMAKYSKLEFHIGHDLETLQRLLSTVTVNTFKFVYWDRKSKSFEIDQQDLQEGYKRFQTYAKTGEEIERYNFAKRYVEFLNSFCGQNSLKNFAGEVMRYNAYNGKYVINERFIFSSYKY